MAATNNTILYGFALIATGAYIRFRIGRNRFNRRNGAGLQLFRSYGHALFIRCAETVDIFFANLLIVAGGILLAAASFHHFKF